MKLKKKKLTVAPSSKELHLPAKNFSKGSFVNVVCSFLLLESATVDCLRICVQLWEACSILILLIYEAFKKIRGERPTGVGHGRLRRFLKIFIGGECPTGVERTFIETKTKGLWRPKIKPVRTSGLSDAEDGS